MNFSVCSQHTEPEGEFRDDADSFVHIPQPLPAPNIVNGGAGLNIIPEGDMILQSLFLGELQYLLHPILVQGLVGVLANILQLNGFVVLMEIWNVLISVSFNGRML
jgi:hypothetical protein